ncbi:alpha/beta hydrolase [Virgibacillus sp. 179-BFC.A HS]|uniref:Alpha/beta hydrolase n=1 Tax=Tigheibacillus jepli TaxID=3035914 RepID=A0ABU5CF33_9BACI|nr:alpha/beta hydrolase [Virgibacillus sp. 179-BFC.A HS]MDY0404942.1 alpha/beta hydrolase [Virgibacillus sp. 179-BFC.A HS]
MKKKLIIIFSALVVVLIAGLIFAGNYFYNQGIKRGTDIELHSESAAVNALASEKDTSMLDEAKAWYDKQEKKTIGMESFDGLKLQAKLIENPAKEHKLVILAHGFRKNGDDMGKYAKMYHDMGFDILLPDARGHGKSEGDYIGYGWHDRLDYKDWIAKMVDAYGEKQIILHGNSMGAATVLMTSGEKLPGQVKGIIADSAYSGVKAELAHQLKYIYHLPSFPLLDVTSVITKVRAGFTFGEASAIEQVKKNKLPLLIIHGDADDLVPTRMGHELYEAAGGDKDLWIVPDAGHTKAFDNVTVAYAEKIKEFVQKALAE